LSGTGHASANSMEHDYQVSRAVIGCAIEVHKALGPGLKESVYHNALCETLSRRNLAYASKRSFPVSFAGVKVGKYEPDLIVQNTVVVEVKAVDRLIPLFTLQVVSYLKITGLRVGLILNFNSRKMTEGIKRVVL
jgi:GxxExxY protein